MTTLKQYRLALQIFQANRLRRDYRDLAEMPQYAAVGEFFFAEMYGPRDFSDRDAQSRRLQHFLHMVPGVHLRDVEQVLTLLELTYRLDDALARAMHAAGVGVGFDEPTYERFYRAADNYADRLRQLQLVDSSLRNVFQLSRSALLGVALHRSHLIARLAGIDVVHDFLTKGYDALRPVAEIDTFAVTIYNRELQRLDRIYQVDDG
jgi:hypothetical protein